MWLRLRLRLHDKGTSQSMGCMVQLEYCSFSFVEWIEASWLVVSQSTSQSVLIGLTEKAMTYQRDNICVRTHKMNAHDFSDH